MKNIDLYMRFLISFTLFAIIPWTVYGQETIQVVTKTIEKDLTCGNIGALRIIGEKSEIEIHGWDKKNMHIKIQLISENKDRKQAEEELEYLHFGLNNEPNLVELSNSFIFPNWHIKIQGNLKARYEIWVPRQYIISIINKFGSINLCDLQTRTMIDAEYSNISIDKYKGYLSVKSSYSDLKADDIHSDLECVADHADIHIIANGGKYHIEDKYGKIDLTTKTKADMVSIKSIWTAITIATGGMDQYNFDVTNSTADILLPDKKYEAYRKTIGRRKTFKLKRTNLPEISVTSTYENIDIK